MSSSKSLSLELKKNKIIKDLHKNRKENLLNTLEVLKQTLETSKKSSFK